MLTIVKGVLDSLDSGLYTDAAAAKAPDGSAMPRSSYGFMADLLTEKGLAPTDAEVRDRVARLARRAGYPSVDALPPYQAERYEQFARDSWALDLMLDAAGIRAKGVAADIVDKFYSTAASTVIFPAFIDSQIMVGRLANPILGDLIATESAVNSHTHEGAILNDNATQRRTRKVGEGSDLPVTTFTIADTANKLSKYGVYFEVSYESIRLQRLNLIAIWLQRIGIQLALDETDDAITTLIAGDGNTGSAITNATDIDADVSGTLDYDELVKLFLAFGDGYNLTTAVTTDVNIRKILNMAEFKDPASGFEFQRSGVLPGPMGANWHRWNTGVAALGAQMILGIDNTVALEKLTEGGVVMESENIIRKQISGTAYSTWVGFHKLDYAAAQVLDVAGEL